jgi:aldose 1-epimerase
VEPFKLGNPGRYRGDLLAPWPNRIRDGKYLVENKMYVVPINEIDRQTALHGLINHLYWNVIEATENRVELEVELSESDSYPTSLVFIVKYELSNMGLAIDIKATNSGDKRAPYGVSIHPYLVANSSEKVNQWKLRLHSSQVLAVDDRRLLPIKLCDVSELDYDFQNGEVIGNRFIDHAFKVDASAPRSVTLLSQDGYGVEMEFDESSHWVQIHTADREGGSDSRACLAVEPMTCPPDAFNSKIDLIWLEPHQSTTSSWRISGIGPSI